MNADADSFKRLTDGETRGLLHVWQKLEDARLNVAGLRSSVYVDHRALDSIAAQIAAEQHKLIECVRTGQLIQDSRALAIPSGR